ncbi:filamentous hemagglutinin N-terminal domain-containing protein [Nostoc sp. CHAB 5836]|uniref:two-partner secretion domain-containing protein n=1 Tax=Nostoc sp. CHAB 5836 TaxID=2780404 RepID=UPI001E3AAE87|nr:filamentous hemagglutinin N-terminal domain-containing protein [Nostoc sp. CHAB 5836]MCC5614773.1 filamentous hemagglutinin N-terminal domain-containing protein [Nostoc sp. CHAB 5836]
MTTSRNWRWKLMLDCIGMSGAIALGVNSAIAQPIADDTLGAESSVVTPNVDINGVPSDLIDGGARRGANLFHSFREFNIDQGRGVYFTNPDGINNILSRVTGGNPSNILGRLGVLGNANLFLINPNGIIFGQNAQLNIGGSFVATTANALQFGNIGFFSATQKNIPSPLLTINPSALLFNQINQNAAIQNNSIAFGLRVPNGKSLLLVGGNVSMDRGGLNANGGRVELGGLGEPGTVALGVDGDNLSLKFPDHVARTSVSLTNSSAVFVTGAGGGNIAVNAKNLEILRGSILSGGIGQGLGTPETVAGDITLNATESIKVAGGSIVGNLVRLGSKGNGGNITIDSGSFSLGDRAQLVTSTFGQGNAGNVTVSAKDAVSLAEASIFSTVEAGGVGKGGNIDINAATLSLIDRAQLLTTTRSASTTQPAGRGDPGNVNVKVTGKVDIAGGKNGLSGISTVVSTETVGNAGNITIDSNSFSLRDQAQLSTSTSGQGNAGNVTVRAKNAVDLAEASIFSTVSAGGVGKGGNIDINAATLSLKDGAVLLTLTRGAFNNQPAGRGDAGNVNINVTGSVDIAGRKNDSPSGIGSNVQTGAVGNGGNITINSGSFSLQDGAGLEASTSGQGNAGNVRVQARDAVSLAGNAGILSTVESGGVGKGGSIDINAATLSLKDGAELLTLTRGAFDTQPAGRGDAGNVNINVTGSVDIAGRKNGFPSGIGSSVQTGTVGNGGNITINSDSFSLQDGAELSTSTFGQGNAGNVNVNVTGLVDIAGEKNGFFSAIFSQEKTETVANGGNITIDSGSFLLREGARVSASTFGQGNAGNVTVRARDAVSLANGKIFSTVDAGSVGKGGNIDINAATLSLKDGGQLQTLTRGAFNNQPAGRGDAGNVNVNVTGSVDIAGGKNSLSGIGSFVDRGTVGNGGNININSGSFSLRDGALLTAETFGQGNAGAIKVNAADFFTISGNNSNINTGLFVNSQSPTGTAGDIIVTSPKVTLDNGGRLNAQSASGNGGDINIQTDLLLLRHGAQISTTAGTEKAGGNGGNITINAPSGFIVAVPSENSDITANAYTGSGGRVDIQAFGIYGIQKSQFPTFLSDITASSEFGVNGTVELNTPDIDPSSGLVNLPTVPVDTQIAQTCTGGSRVAKSSFTIIGRGGLPPNPGNALNTDAVQVDLVTLNPEVGKSSTPAVSTNPTSPAPDPIVEASGWAIAANGDVILTANAATVTPHSSWQNPADCRALNQQ